MKLTVYCTLTPRFRMSGCVPPFSQMLPLTPHGQTALPLPLPLQTTKLAWFGPKTGERGDTAVSSEQYSWLAHGCSRYGVVSDGQSACCLLSWLSRDMAPHDWVTGGRAAFRNSVMPSVHRPSTCSVTVDGLVNDRTRVTVRVTACSIVYELLKFIKLCGRV